MWLVKTPTARGSFCCLTLIVMPLYEIIVVNGHMSDILNDELSAMQQVAVALAQLDEPTRLRVLQWAIDRFHVDLSATSRAVVRQTGHESLAHSDTGAEADEGLSVSTLEDLFNPSAPDPQAAVPGDAPRQAVSGMLSDFAAEFQSVVREWNAADEVPADDRDQRASSAA